MQTINWYVRRLRQMDAGEIVWRGRSAIRGAGDRMRYALRLYPSLVSPPAGRFADTTPLPPLCPVPVAAYTDGATSDCAPRWLAALRASADHLADHKFTFLGLRDRDLGHPIKWNRDHEAGTDTPSGYAGAIDYRDPAVAGDAKIVWEPNRHLHLPILGRAYRATGELAYARTAIGQLDSWLTDCPFGTGMNWRSPLELAIRAINWCWLLALIEPAGVVHGEARRRVLNALDLHVQDVAAKYSRWSSANNHRIGEAAGVFVATSCCPSLTASARHRRESLEILCAEILTQNHPDGGNREQAFAYHLFVLQFLLIAAHAARVTRQPLPESYLDRLSAMVNFAEVLTAAGPAPRYGDDDEGYVLDLGGRQLKGRELVAVGDALLDRAPRDCCEPLTWMFGAAPAGPCESAPGEALTSHAFPDSGLYLLQWGRRGASDATSLTFDCGELGFGPLAAHGHADALAFTLRALGEDIFVDAGTFDYFRYPAWRAYFRSTRAHNTIVVDDLDQSVMLEPFMWGRRASARCIDWSACGERARVSGEHDGYMRLTDPVRHRRTVEMDGSERTFVITDALDMRETHQIDLLFHVTERAAVTRRGSHDYEIAVAHGLVVLTLDSQLAAVDLHGSEQPIAGWVSRGYHARTASTTIVASLEAHHPVTITTRILICPAAR